MPDEDVRVLGNDDPPNPTPRRVFPLVAAAIVVVLAVSLIRYETSRRTRSDSGGAAGSSSSPAATSTSSSATASVTAHDLLNDKALTPLLGPRVFAALRKSSETAQPPYPFRSRVNAAASPNDSSMFGIVATSISPTVRPSTVEFTVFRSFDLAHAELNKDLTFLVKRRLSVLHEGNGAIYCGRPIPTYSQCFARRGVVVMRVDAGVDTRANSVAERLARWGISILRTAVEQL